MTQLKEFRQDMYDNVLRRVDASMDLLDALTANTTARSVVELSLNGPFRRGYGSVYTAIGGFFQPDVFQKIEDQRRIYDKRVMGLLAPYLPVPKQRPFWLFGLDVTPAPRPFARTLEDRSFVHQPNTIWGNKPIAIGHQYSTLALLPEKTGPQAPPWVVPLTTRRVDSAKTGTEVGVQQVEDLLSDETLPFAQDLCVEVADGAYSNVSFLGPITDMHPDNLVTISRLRGNRTLYRPAPPVAKKPGKRGRHPWYGQAFKLKDETTWEPPDEEIEVSYITPRGRHYRVQIKAWQNLLMRGTKDYDMHQQFFTLIRCRVFNEKDEQVFQRPLWLLVMGARREDLSLIEVWQAYRQRYDLEHFFRFGKQRLLMNAYQTPEVEHEENWWQMVQLAYVQLWMARSLAQGLPNPWERYLTYPNTEVSSPSATQRDFGRILQQIGTPAKAPKPRGKSPGRAPGHRLEPRQRHPVIKKGSKNPLQAQQIA
jgi:hypothetical protein